MGMNSVKNTLTCCGLSEFTAIEKLLHYFSIINITIDALSLQRCLESKKVGSHCSNSFFKGAVKERRAYQTEDCKP